MALLVPLSNDEDFPILQYALQADVAQLNHLKDILAEFAGSTSLKVNFDKSFMVPINVSDERLDT